MAEQNLHSNPDGGNSRQYINGDVNLITGLDAGAFTSDQQAGPDHGPEKAFDGEPPTFYDSGEYPPDFNYNTPGAVLCIDFGDPVQVAGLTMRAASTEQVGDSSHHGMPAVFYIDASDDGVNWDDIHLVDLFYKMYLPYEPQQSRFIGFPEHRCPDIGYRYWRLRVLRTFGRVRDDIHNPVIRIAEIEVHPFIES